MKYSPLYLRLYLSREAPWKRPDAVDGYIDCKTHSELRIKFWGYALAGVRCWRLDGFDGWDCNDRLRDKEPHPYDCGPGFVKAVLDWRDNDLAIQREREQDDRVRDLVTEALNTVHDRLGELAGMGQAAMVEAVAEAAAEYVRISFEESPNPC